MAGLLPLQLACGGFNRPDDYVEEHCSLLPSPIIQVAKAPASKPTRTREFPTQIDAPSNQPPYTKREWRRVLGDVKRDYQSRKYRACSTKCADVLDKVPRLRTFEPAYLIFLHFYAATSLEMQVRSLHQVSSHKVKMLKEARAHYRRADELIMIEKECSRSSQEQEQEQEEEEEAASLNSPWLASVESPTALGFSDYSRSTSPSSSSDGDGSMTKLTAAATPTRKRVTFADDVTTCADSEAPPGSAIQASSATEPHSQETLSSSTENSVDPDPSEVSTTLQPQDGQSEGETGEDRNGNDILERRQRSILCYVALLSDVHEQVATHTVFVDREMAASAKAAPPPAPSNDELRALDLKARIERLRAAGWPRRQFDARRYERLRERAMEDMMT